jgi:S-adenosylmethionine hydrolase
LTGEIIHVDVFGNLVSSIDEQNLVDFFGDRRFSIRIGRHRVQGLRRGYWEGKKGDVVALIGSGGFLEISVREGSARRKLKRGDRIRITIENGR